MVFIDHKLVVQCSRPLGCVNADVVVVTLCVNSPCYTEAPAIANSRHWGNNSIAKNRMPAIANSRQVMLANNGWKNFPVAFIQSDVKY